MVGNTAAGKAVIHGTAKVVESNILISGGGGQAGGLAETDIGIDF